MNNLCTNFKTWIGTWEPAENGRVINQEAHLSVKTFGFLQDRAIFLVSAIAQPFTIIPSLIYCIIAFFAALFYLDGGNNIMEKIAMFSVGTLAVTVLLPFYFVAREIVNFIGIFFPNNAKRMNCIFNSSDTQLPTILKPPSVMFEPKYHYPQQPTD